MKYILAICMLFLTGCASMPTQAGYDKFVKQTKICGYDIVMIYMTRGSGDTLENFCKETPDKENL